MPTPKAASPKTPLRRGLSASQEPSCAPSKTPRLKTTQKPPNPKMPRTRLPETTASPLAATLIAPITTAATTATTAAAADPATTTSAATTGNAAMTDGPEHAGVAASRDTCAATAPIPPTKRECTHWKANAPAPATTMRRMIPLATIPTTTSPTRHHRILNRQLQLTLLTSPVTTSAARSWRRMRQSRTHT